MSTTLSGAAVVEQLFSQTTLQELPTAFADLRRFVEENSSCKEDIRRRIAVFARIPKMFLDASGCDQSLEELPSLIDLMREESMLAAAEIFPRVFWHVLVCETCYRTFEATVALIEAEAAHELQPMPSFLPPKRPNIRLPRFRVPRFSFFQVYAMNTALGVARGNDHAANIATDEAEGYEVKLGLYKNPRNQWMLTFHIVPPVEGSIVVTIGGTTLRAPLQTDGSAELEDVPEALLSSASGPDMEVAIELL